MFLLWTYNVQLENMKYECSNCQYCCISTSSDISYCGLLSECNQTAIDNGLLVGISILSIVVFSCSLIALYFLFRNRSFKQNQQPQVKIQSEKIERDLVVKRKGSSQSGSEDMKQKVNISKKSKLSKFHKFSKPSLTVTDTQRGLR